MWRSLTPTLGLGPALPKPSFYNFKAEPATRTQAVESVPRDSSKDRENRGFGQSHARFPADPPPGLSDRNSLLD